MAIYHRLASPSQTLQTAIYQCHSKQIWGQAARGSLRPTVKAYFGKLPPNERGIEFETDVLPHPGSTPTTAKWYFQITPEVTQVPGEPDFVMMAVAILKLKYNPAGQVGLISCDF